MKKIVIVTLSISKIGGTERMVCNLANILSEQYEIYIVACNNNATCFYDLTDKVNIATLNLPEVPQSFIKKINWYKIFAITLKKFVKLNRINYIMGTTHAINSMLPFSTVSNVKTIGCEHVVYDSVPKIYSIIRRLMYPRLDAIVVLTDSAKRYFKYHSRTYVIPNFLSEIPDNTAKLDADAVLAIGRYDYGKGFDRLIRIAAIVKKEIGDRIKFKIVGEGERKQEFLNLINELDLNDTVFLIPPTKEIGQEYLTSSLYLMTSHSEALPMVLLEAKSYGLPIISFACNDGPTSLIKDTVDGFLIENNNLNDFAGKIIELMTDQQKRMNMGLNSRLSTKLYKKEEVVKLWQNLFENL